ncbi:MAG: PEGA domain-containing protein [Deltaproteobacteria bacterium]|nr:PEGA domain-containing protein [Deltaproteobacteria bacterium]
MNPRGMAVAALGVALLAPHDVAAQPPLPEAPSVATESVRVEPTPSRDVRGRASLEPVSSSEPTEQAQPTSSATRVGLLPLVIAANVAAEVDDVDARLSAQVRDAFGDATAQLVALPADQTGDARAPYCADKVCWQALAAQFEVSHVLVVSVTFEDPDYRVGIELVDGRTGDVISDSDRACDLCGMAELGTQVGDMAATMRRELEASMVPAPRLVVTSVPSGAEVELDGEPVGLTPLNIETVEGPHRITVRRFGHVVERQQFELVEGVERRVDVQLRPAPVPVAAPTAVDRRRTGLVAGGGAALAAGIGVVGGGVAMVVLHGGPIQRDCSGDNVDALGRCRYLHDTRSGGIAMLVTGGLLAAGGIAMVVIGAKRARTQSNTQRRWQGLAVRF